MNKFYKPLITIALLLITLNLFATDFYENKRIANIKISIENPDPDASFDSKTVLTSLKSQTNDYFSQNIFDSDLKKLSEEYDRIIPHVEVQNDEVYITIKLWLRPIIRTLNFQGNEHIKTKKLQSELGIEVYSQFNRQEFYKALNKLKAFYIKKGYFESEINYSIKPVERKNEVDISIKIKEGKAGKIKTLEFKGFTKKEESDLLNMMYTKTHNFLTSWFTGTGIFNEDALDQDKMTMINYLQNKGYADAKVDINIIDDIKSNKIIIELIAHRGTLYRFGKVTFDGNTILSDKDIEKSFLIFPDNVYSPDKIRETAQSIKDVYGAKGYIETQVYYETHLMENDPIYNVDFQIEESDEFKIGLIKIYGNKSTKTNVILRESLLVPGEKFDTRKLKATQRRLENIGYFKSVNVYAVQANEDLGLGPNYRDVHIEVEETQTGNFSASAGYSSSESIYGVLDLSENNFDHRGLFKIFSEGPSALRGGGEFAKIKGTIGKKEKNVAVSWMDPYFRDSRWRVGTELSYTRSTLQSRDYKIHTYGGSLYGSYPLTNFLSYGGKYRVRQSINRVRKGSSLKKNIELEQLKTEGLVSAVGAILSYDSTDNSYKAHRGLRSALDVEYVGVGGKYNFFKLQLVNSYYYPLWSKGTIKYRAELKFIDTISRLTEKKVPVSERFFLGGENSVRGYKPFIIGSKLDDSHDPKGGVSSLLLSIEYLQSIFRPMVDAFIFADAGSIAYKRYEIRKLNASVGVGLRLEIMNRVPIIVGWGYPINPDKHRDRQSIFFSMAGQF